MKRLPCLLLWLATLPAMAAPMLDDLCSQGPHCDAKPSEFRSSAAPAQAAELRYGGEFRVGLPVPLTHAVHQGTALVARDAEGARYVVEPLLAKDLQIDGLSQAAFARGFRQALAGNVAEYRAVSELPSEAAFAVMALKHFHAVGEGRFLRVADAPEPVFCHTYSDEADCFVFRGEDVLKLSIRGRADVESIITTLGD